MGGAAAASSVAPVPAGGAPLKSTSDQPPRKVIVGTMMQAFWGEHPGIEKRLEGLAAIVDRVSEESRKKYSRGPDLVVLPETAVTGEAGDDVAACAVPYEGPVKNTFAQKAREHRCYIVVPMYLLEDRERKLASNASILVDRKGETAGIYRKVHLAVSPENGLMEGGTTPGKEAPVFDCDFGKVGIQICFDIYFDYGWEELARKGAELVAWPTQSPQTALPAFRSMEHRYYVVSSTWRNNASIFEPTGRITAQIKPPQQVLVQELDLSYAILQWSRELKKGEGLRKMYGDRAGYRYYEDEDCGIFWSNDRHTTVGQMVRSLGVAEAEEKLRWVRRLYRKAGVPGS